MRLLANRLLLLATVGLLAACGSTPPKYASKARYTAVDINTLPGWQMDATPGDALLAFQRSCTAWTKANPERTLGKGEMTVAASEWQARCLAAITIPPTDHAAARAFFANNFTPMKVEPMTTDNKPWNGLVTGYYEPLLFGSRHCDAPGQGRYTTPLYRLPPDRVQGEEYYDRAAIDRGVLAGRGLEILCVDDPVAAFFLEIQGSGRIALAEGGTVHVNYAGQNGHEYVAIGRILGEENAIPKPDISLFTIRQWLKSHPDQAPRIMQSNPSYVFFKEREPAPDPYSLLGDGPLGAQGVPLTPQRSVAVDPRFAPYGAPILLDTTLPKAALGTDTDQPLHRLFIAQDTGGAIKGPSRADLFFGFEPPAETFAGYMKQRANFTVFLPPSLAQRLNGRIVE